MKTTANIWTHLLGAFQFITTLYQFRHLPRYSDDDHSDSDVTAISVYYLCVVTCFLLSTFFHTFSDHSALLHRFGNELDHLGIVLVIWGTGVSGAHFAFRCEHHLRHTYFIALTATALGCAVFTLRPKFRQPSYRTVRFLMYCFLGTSIIAPVVHGGMKFGMESLSERMDVGSFAGLAVVNFSGAAIYAVRVPERWFPGTFDLLGQSHNLMHVLVWTGAVVRQRGLLLVVERWRDGLVVCSGWK